MNTWQKAKVTSLQNQKETHRKKSETQNIHIEENKKLLKEYNHCCLCGQELLFTHVTNFIKLEVLEEAYCSNCNIKNKKDFHRLQ